MKALASGLQSNRTGSFIHESSGFHHAAAPMPPGSSAAERNEPCTGDRGLPHAILSLLMSATSSAPRSERTRPAFTA